MRLWHVHWPPCSNQPPTWHRYLNVSAPFLDIRILLRESIEKSVYVSSPLARNFLHRNSFILLFLPKHLKALKIHSIHFSSYSLSSCHRPMHQWHWPESLSLSSSHSRLLILICHLINHFCILKKMLKIKSHLGKELTRLQKFLDMYLLGLLITFPQAPINTYARAGTQSKVLGQLSVADILLCHVCHLLSVFL